MGGGTNITSSCSQKEHGMYKEQKGQLGRKQREACGLEAKRKITAEAATWSEDREESRCHSSI